MLAGSINSELAAGTEKYTSADKEWGDGWKDYVCRNQNGQFRYIPNVNRLAKRPQTQRCLRESLDRFDQLLKPKRLSGITTAAVDDFRAKLRMQPGKKRGSTMSPATINKHLRHLRVALRKAHRWGYLMQVPEFEMEREPVKLVRYVTAEHFALMYEHADVATMPEGFAVCRGGLVACTDYILLHDRVANQ